MTGWFFSLVPKLQLGDALAPEAPASWEDSLQQAGRRSAPPWTKQSFADMCVTKLELGHEARLYDAVADRSGKHDIAAEPAVMVSRMKAERENLHLSVMRSYNGRDCGEK